MIILTVKYVNNIAIRDITKKLGFRPSHHKKHKIYLLNVKYERSFLSA